MIIYINIDFLMRKSHIRFFLVKSTSKNKKNYTVSTFIGYYMFICKVVQNNAKPLPKRTQLAHILNICITIIILSEKNALKAS